MAKLSLPPASLASFLSALLPSCTLLSSLELTNPLSLNTVYLLHTQPHGSLILKLPPSPSARLLRYERGLFTAEHALTTFLSSPTISILPPHATNGTYVFDPSLAIIDASFLLRPYLEGWTLATLPPSVPGWLKKVNSIGSPSGRYGFFENPVHATYADFFISLFESVLLDGEELLVFLPFEGIRAEIEGWKWVLGAEYQGKMKEAGLVVFGLGTDEIVVDEVGGVKGLAGAWGRGCWGCWELQGCLRGEEAWRGYFGEGWKEEMGKVGWARVLLHDLLLATCRIVTLFYRQAKMTDEEMNQRRKLVGTLEQLKTLRNSGSL